MLYKCFKLGVYCHFRLFHDLQIYGREHLPLEGPAIIVSNHPSYIDPIIISLASPRKVRFMAWDALFKVPVMSYMIRTFGAYPVDPYGAPTPSAIKNSLRILKNGEVMGIFPEGGRTHLWDTLLYEFRPGFAKLAFTTGSPIIPTSITGTQDIWPRHRKFPRLSGDLSIRFHKPIEVEKTPSRKVSRDMLDNLCQQVRSRIHRRLIKFERAKSRKRELGISIPPYPNTAPNGEEET